MVTNVSTSVERALSKCSMRRIINRFSFMIVQASFKPSGFKTNIRKNGWMEVILGRTLCYYFCLMRLWNVKWHLSPKMGTGRRFVAQKYFCGNWNFFAPFRRKVHSFGVFFYSLWGFFLLEKLLVPYSCLWVKTSNSTREMVSLRAKLRESQRSWRIRELVFLLKKTYEVKFIGEDWKAPSSSTFKGKNHGKN